MVNGITESEEFFEVISVLRKKIRITVRYWEHIVKHKHPELDGMLEQAFDALKNADEAYLTTQAKRKGIIVWKKNTT